jgi:hypothetical protein
MRRSIRCLRRTSSSGCEARGDPLAGARFSPKRYMSLVAMAKSLFLVPDTNLSLPQALIARFFPKTRIPSLKKPTEYLCLALIFTAETRHYQVIGPATASFAQPAEWSSSFGKAINFVPGTKFIATGPEGHGPRGRPDTQRCVFCVDHSWNHNYLP